MMNGQKVCNTGMTRPTYGKHRSHSAIYCEKYLISRQKERNDNPDVPEKIFGATLDKRAKFYTISFRFFGFRFVERRTAAPFFNVFHETRYTKGYTVHLWTVIGRWLINNQMRTLNFVWPPFLWRTPPPPPLIFNMWSRNGIIFNCSSTSSRKSVWMCVFQLKHLSPLIPSTSDPIKITPEIGTISNRPSSKVLSFCWEIAWYMSDRCETLKNEE